MSTTKSAWAAMALASSILFVSAPAAAVDVGERAPQWTLSGIDGKSVDYPADAAGNPSVVLFWATWCPYCRALMPYLDQIRSDYADRGVSVFAVNIKEDGDPVEHMRELGFDFIVALDGDPVAEKYAVKYTPGLFVVDGAGTILFRRKPTEARAGKTIAELWSGRVRESLDAALDIPAPD